MNISGALLADGEMQGCKIDWKNDGKNLVKQYPKSVNEDDDGELQEAGSFFNWFVDDEDDGGVRSSTL